MISAIEALVNGKFKAKPAESSFATLDLEKSLVPEALNSLRTRLGIASVDIFKGKVQVQYNTLVLTEEMVVERVKDAEKTVKQRDENASEEVQLRLTSTEGVAGKDTIEKLLLEQPGVLKVHFDEEGVARISYDPDLTCADLLVASIEES